MPRQTPSTQQILFPDGFRMEVSTDGTTGADWKDVGVLSAGAQMTFNWDDFVIDAGNYEGLVDGLKNPTVALAPSALMNFDPTVIKAVFGGLFTSVAATTPNDGTDITYAGSNKYLTLDRFKIRLTHYDVDATGGTETDADIDWQFTIHYAKIDAGASFNMKGVNEDGLDEITVSFTGKPDPASAYALATFFKQTVA